jgi:hypothetical protein
MANIVAIRANMRTKINQFIVMWEEIPIKIIPIT